MYPKIQICNARWWSQSVHDDFTNQVLHFICAFHVIFAHHMFPVSVSLTAGQTSVTWNTLIWLAGHINLNTEIKGHVAWQLLLARLLPLDERFHWAQWVKGNYNQMEPIPNDGKRFTQIVSNLQMWATIIGSHLTRTNSKPCVNQVVKLITNIGYEFW